MLEGLDRLETLLDQTCGLGESFLCLSTASHNGTV